MPWPFSRRKPRNEPAEGPTSRPEAPRAAGADQALVEEILTWFGTHHAELSARQDDTHPVILLGAPTAAPESGRAATPAGAILKVRRGKLSWIDLYDAGLRDPINALIKELDRQQKWSFNGVVSTKYDEPSQT